MARGVRRSPGGVGDGLPAMPNGEPLLARWFVLVMIPLVVAAIVVTVWAFVEFGGRDQSTAADRRPPGSATVTHERGQAVLNEVRDTEEGSNCATGVTMVGDPGALATTRRAMAAACQLLASGDFPEVQAGLEVWREGGGVLRIATFEFTGTESSARVEDEVVVVELSPRFQFDDATRGAPFILHELVHLGTGQWPGTPVSVSQELAATEVTQRACERLSMGEESPLGCLDAADLLSSPDPAALLRAAGYRDE